MEKMEKFVTALDSDGLEAAYSLLQAFALWLTLALAAILLVCFLVVKFKKPQMKDDFKKLALGVTIGYSVALIACISVLRFARMKLKNEFDANFYLVLGFLALLLIYAICALITAATNKKAFKACNAVGGALSLIYALTLLFVIPTQGEDYAPLSDVGIYGFSALLVSAILIPCIVFGKDDGTATPSKSLAFAGICTALSFALSYIKIFTMPQSGSVTLASMLPLIIYAYVFGARKGLFVGAIYGFLQCVQNPQIYQPMQVLLDYPVAFGAIGLAGISKNMKFLKTPLLKFIFGASLACLGRYAAHFISGYYVFSSWAMEGYTALSWSLVYNLFIMAELAIILFVGIILFRSESFCKELTKINPPEKISAD